MNYQYKPFDINYLTEESKQEKRSLTSDCTKLGVLLLMYIILNNFFAYAWYYAAYFVTAKRFTLDYSTMRDYLVENQAELISSTGFVMGANIAVTVLSLLVIILAAKFLLRLDFHGFLRPGSDGVKTGLKWLPFCFVINMILSLLTAYLSVFLSASGITLPSSDFSISSPSAVSLIMQFAYVIVLAPILEEFIYRGLILGVLSKYGNSAAILLSALAFGLMHGNIPQAVSAFGTGIVYAVIAVNSGSIFPTIIIHSLNNLIASFTEFSDVLDFQYGDLIFSLIEILLALVGFFLLFTKYRSLKYDENTSHMSKQLVRKTVFSNPAVLIYIAVLVFDIFKGILRAN